MQNPFTIGITEGSNFCNREKELRELKNYALNQVNIVLYSPRRYGKSSLTIRLLSELSKEDFLTVYLDLFPISSKEDFIYRLATGIFKAIGKGVYKRTFFENISHLFRSIVPTVEYSAEGISFSVKFNKDEKLEILLEDLFQGTYKYLKEKESKAIIALDEFQEITELNESKYIEGIIRSFAQFHKEIVFFFVGSRRRLLLDMFTNKNRPFYKSSFLYPLKEIPEEEFMSYIIKKFEDSKKICPKDTTKYIFEAVQGYPYYVQKLSSLAWDITEKVCEIETARKAYEILIKMESIDFEGVWSNLALGQKALLKAIAFEPTSSPFTKEYLRKYGLSLGGAQKAIKALLLKDLIEKTDSKIYRLTDPVMADWLTSV
ncbi:MAG TPA: ATP-binding protein [Caldisericia bacterium]|nr:ATP-binding protein [Caldisericia bacterium]HPO28761.1 ATP-binding protein [Caldisericia bacterium]HXK70690.1 ATP-binding protein [Caldisericia bacterium]